jgi:hypothetical protein
MPAAINAAATTGVITMVVLSLVGVWVTTQLRLWRMRGQRRVGASGLAFTETLVSWGPSSRERR